MCGHRRSTRSRGREAQEPRDRTVRASDADRDRTAEVLREQAGLGRLDADELEQRLEAALSAKTLADLDALTADLPQGRPEREERRERRHVHPGWVVSPLVLLIAVLIGVSILAGHPVFWPLFLLFLLKWRPWFTPRRRWLV